MLKWIDNVEQLSFFDLMRIYSETNLKDCAMLYPELSTTEALFCVESSFYHFVNDVFFKTNGAKYAVWTQDESWVSALRIEPYFDGMLLSGLETHPDHRKRGYAKRLIGCVISQLKSGTKVYTHIQRNNIASVAAHTACGFSKISDRGHMLDGSVDLNMDTYLTCCP